MSSVPGARKLPKFVHELRGTYGRFKTEQSYRLDYLMTSVAIESVDTLSTASELFRLESIDFEELIQRDIDYGRVRRIANEYLSRGQGRVVFFPPLLACVVLLEDGAIKRTYSQVDFEEVVEEKTPVLQTTWDSDGFRLDLPEAEADSSDRRVDWKGSSRYVYEFAATLKLNPKRAKLVVLDGQHRLEAMRLLCKNAEQKKIIEGLEIPICVVWAPAATTQSGTDEDMMRDFRELFVRVNSESRRVSGHFIILLRDDSYTALTMRSFADRWKAINEPGGWTRLHLLEWNTREDERADVRTRDSSITTLSVVAKTLEEFLFRADAAASILDLEDEADAFAEADEDFAWNGLTDKTHGPAIDEIIRKKIKEILVPSLDVLFRTPTPYSKLEKKLGDGFAKLQQQVDQNNASFIRLKTILNTYIYAEDEIFEDSARSAYVDFKGWVAADQNDRIYFLSVFQQAMIRFWLRVSAVLKTFGVNGRQSASVVVRGLEAVCFDSVDRSKVVTTSLIKSSLAGVALSANR